MLSLLFAFTVEVPLQNDANNSGGVAAMDLVVDLMKHLNEDSVPGNLAEKDTPAIHNIQREMDRVTQLIQNFMKTSLDLVDKEGIIEQFSCLKITACV